MADCWSCGAERGDASSCTTCGKLQPLSPRATLFSVLGLAPRMTLDPKVLDQAFRDVSRNVHPDRFGQASPIERKLALEHTTRVNEAYRTLKDAMKRGEYLMRLEGVDVAAEEHRVENKLLLMEMLELQEEVEDAKPDRLDAIRSSLRTRERAVLTRVARYFDERSADGTPPLSRKECVDALNELRYLRRLGERIDAKLDEV
ncbi:Fe-S protein assembly co-chaperone HscB [Myxococcota bacterium]|nr:Fe-S protein assembly co-chaperone HscB [Myxococcota bacterium]